MIMADLETQIQRVSAAIAGLELQRSNLGDAVVEPAIAALREQLAQLETGRTQRRTSASSLRLCSLTFRDLKEQTSVGSWAY
jgi:hypothetical protein